jgi:hypothetical protein
MSAVQIPKIELACDELTILKQQYSVSAYLQEIEIRKTITKAMTSPANWQELYKLLAPHCCATVQKLIENNKYNLPPDRKEELLNGATYNISQDIAREVMFSIVECRIVEGFALLIIYSKLHLTILTNPISRIINNGSKREKKD